MIVIDYSQTIISNLMAEIGNRTDVELDVNLLRHMVINTIRSHKVKFGKEYGEVVIACDSRKYWRKEVFPYYKANRKKAREDSGFNWPLIFDSINLIKEELKAIFPYRVIEI
jgi:5'-3' exonuclease